MYSREFSNEEKKAYKANPEPGFTNLSDWISYVVESQIKAFIAKAALKEEKLTTDPNYLALVNERKAKVKALITTELEAQNSGE